MTEPPIDIGALVSVQFYEEQRPQLYVVTGRRDLGRNDYPYPVWYLDRLDGAAKHQTAEAGYLTRICHNCHAPWNQHSDGKCLFMSTRFE